MEKQNAIQKFLKDNGMEVLPDSKTWINRFEIKSQSSNKIYVVAQRANQSEWGCSCMGWIRYRSCKHLKTIMPLIEAAEKAAGVKRIGNK